MDMSVISPFNVLEKAREMKSEVFLSSGDITKEFRYRVPIQARMWTYARLGVLVEIAKSMTAFDINCAVVFCTLRN